MIKVLKIMADGTGVVDLTGLFRVLMQPGDEIARELCEPHSAEAFVVSFNSSGKGSWAEAIDYAEVFQRASSA